MNLNEEVSGTNHDEVADFKPHHPQSGFTPSSPRKNTMNFCNFLPYNFNDRYNCSVEYPEYSLYFIGIDECIGNEKMIKIWGHKTGLWGFYNIYPIREMISIKIFFQIGCECITS
jgi:hypothetical protein